MALANHRVRQFNDIAALSKFIQTDAGITGIVAIMGDGQGSGGYILVYTVA